MSKKLIVTTGTEFEQNLKNIAMIETTDRAGKPTMIASAELNEAYTNADAAAKALLNFDLEGEEKTVSITSSSQVITPSTGKNAMTKVTIDGVNIDTETTIGAEGIDFSSGDDVINVTLDTGDCEITLGKDSNLTAANIKKDVVIYGVTGTYEAE